LVRYIEENEDDYPTIREPLAAAYLTLLVEGRLSHALPLRGEVKIGRDKTNGVVTADQKVSRHHATLSPIDDNTFIISDHGSANGTYINGVLISQPTRLRQNDKIRFGDTTFLFTTSAPPVEVGPFPPSLPQPMPSPAGPPPAGQSSTLFWLSENNIPIWAVIGCMALAIIVLLIIVAIMFGVFVGRSQVGLLLLWGLGG
jgi:hypothetical protein